MIEWLREQGCPWGVSPYYNARKHINVLNWLKDNECPCAPSDDIQEVWAVEYGTMEWLMDNNLTNRGLMPYYVFYQEMSRAGRVCVLKWLRAESQNPCDCMDAIYRVVTDEEYLHDSDIDNNILIEVYSHLQDEGYILPTSLYHSAMYADNYDVLGWLTCNGIVDDDVRSRYTGVLDNPIIRCANNRLPR